MTPNAVLVVRLVHTGVYADGRPNRSSVFIPDGDWGLSQEHRKTPLYVPAGGFIDVPLTSHTLYSLSKGSIAGFVKTGQLRVETMARLRDPSDLGGAGSGVPLWGGGDNVERVSGTLRVVLSNTDVDGFIAGEKIALSGFTGVNRPLNEEYVITAIAKNSDLSGANFLTWTLEMASAGADIPAAAFPGITATLPDGKVRFQAMGAGNAGGLGSTSTTYIAGDLNVTGIIDPTALQMNPMTSADAPPLSVFVSNTDGALYFKQYDNVLVNLLTGGGGGGGGGGGNTFTYRPGGLADPANNIYNTWASAHVAAAAFPATSYLSVDNTFANPATIPAGVWDMSGIILSGNLNPTGVGFDFYSHLQALDGAVLTNLFHMRNLIRLESVSSSPVFEINNPTFMIIDFGTYLESNGTSPMFLVNTGAFLNIIMLEGSQLSSGASSLIQLNDGEVTIQQFENSFVGSNIFTGASVNNPVVMIASPGSDFSTDQSSWTGGPVTLSLQSKAEYIRWDSNFYSTWTGNAEDVNSIINEIIPRVSVPVWVFRPNGGRTGIYYDNWIELMNDMLAFPGSKTLVLDPSLAINSGVIDITDGGGYDMSEVHLTTTTSYNTNPIQVTFYNGAGLLNLSKISGNMTFINNNPGGWALAWTMVYNKPVYFEGNIQFESSNGGSVMSVFSTEAEFWFKDRIYMRANTGPVFTLENPSGTARLYIGDQCVIEDNVLVGNQGGTWDVRITSPSVQYGFSQPAVIDPSYNPIYTYPIGGLTRITDLINTGTTAQYFDTMRLDTSIGPFVVSLPDASILSGGFIEFKGNGGVNTVTIATIGGQTIDGSPSQNITGNGFLRVRSDGTNWMIV
jgi:hypothetical protein